MKKGLILRSEIRRVPCPKCGAAPGAFCTTFDKREHQERATAAIAASPSDNVAQDAPVPLPAPALQRAEAAVQEIAQVHDVAVGVPELKPPVVLCPAPPADPVFDAIAEPDDDDGKAFAAYLAKLQEKLQEKQKLVRVTWYHGPLVLSWDGYITRFGDGWQPRPTVSIVQADGKYISILAGQNDSIIITDL